MTNFLIAFIIVNGLVHLGALLVLRMVLKRLLDQQDDREHWNG